VSRALRAFLFLIAMNKFSYFEGGIHQVIPTSNLSLDDAAERISAPLYKDRTERIRELYNVYTSDPSKENNRAVMNEKKRLDYCTFAGVFRKRDLSELVEPSGFACFDIEGENDDPDDMKHQILRVSNAIWKPRLIFTSPSAKGIKAIFEVVGDYARYYYNIRLFMWTALKVMTDPTTDMSRACFMCYDPDLWYQKG